VRGRRRSLKLGHGRVSECVRLRRERVCTQISLDPCFVLGLGLDGDSVCFSAGSHHLAMSVVVYDGGDLCVASDMFLAREPGSSGVCVYTQKKRRENEPTWLRRVSWERRLARGWHRRRR